MSVNLFDLGFLEAAEALAQKRVSSPWWSKLTESRQTSSISSSPGRLRDNVLASTLTISESLASAGMRSSASYSSEQGRKAYLTGTSS